MVVLCNQRIGRLKRALRILNEIQCGTRRTWQKF